VCINFLRPVWAGTGETECDKSGACRTWRTSARRRGAVAMGVVVVVLVVVALVMWQSRQERALGIRLADPPCPDRLQVVRVPNALPLAVHAEIAAALGAARAAGQFHRSVGPTRSGAALALGSASVAQPSLGCVVRAFRDAALTARVQAACNSHLQLVPRTDVNELSALLYCEPGDGIDEHMDGNVYLGSRWAAIYSVEDDGDAQLEIAGVPVHMVANEMVLFRADLLRHRVRRRRGRGTRLVVNALYCDVCAPRAGPLARLWSWAVALTFYG